MDFVLKIFRDAIDKVGKFSLENSKKWIVCFVFLPGFLAASLVDIQLYMGPGYRKDSFCLDFFNPDNSSEKDYSLDVHNVHSAQQALYVNFLWDHFRWEFWGAYGWLVEGKQKVKLTEENFFSFKFKNIDGYQADGSTSLGYDLPVYTRRAFQFYLSPFFGVKYWHTATRAKGRRVSITSASGFPVAAIYEETRITHSDLWGPFVEGRVTFNVPRLLQLKLLYQYHFIYLRTVQDPSLDIISQPGVPPVTVRELNWHAVISDDHARAHLGGFDMYINVTNRFVIGGKAYGTRVYTRKAKGKRHRFIVNIPGNASFVDLTGSAEVRWTVFSGILYLGYQF